MNPNYILDDSLFKDLTIVVPTLGKNLSSIWVSNILKLASLSITILIILPPDSPESVDNLSFSKISSNICIFNSTQKGQVAQRIFGFSLVRTEFVLQLDDDVIIEPNTLLSLLRILNLSDSPLAISPLIRNPRLATFSKDAIQLLTFFRNAFLYFNLSPKPGSISKSGFPIPFSFNNFSSVQSVSWLPGCCILHRIRDTYNFNYFPFLGKAYCEDLIHSFHLLRNGISLAIATDQYIETPISSFVELPLIGFLKYISNDYRIRSHYVRLTSNNIILTRIAYLFIIVSYIIRSLLTVIFHPFKSFHK